MAKKEKTINGSTALIVLLLLIILAMLYTYSDNFKDYYSNTPTFKLTDYNVPQQDQCSDYDIPTEYRNIFGNTAINVLENGCNAISGVYIEQLNELSCYWNPTTYFLSCDSDNIQTFGNFCENELQGSFHCNADTAYVGCVCDTNIPNRWVETSPPDDDWNDNEQYDVITPCGEVVLPAYGDLGGICRSEGTCINDESLSCEHYWDYNDRTHRCGCVETTFCGQYCFSYFYLGTNCECPPGSFKELTSRSTYQCVPDGKSCDGGNVID